MANETKHSDLLKDDGAIDELIAKLKLAQKEGNESLKSLREEAKRLEKELAGVTATTTDGREELGKYAKETAKLEKTERELAGAFSENAKQLAVLREGKRKAAQIVRAEAKLNIAAAGSYDELSAKYSLIKIRLNAMSAAQRGATVEGQKLEKESRAIREEMNRLQKATGNTSLEVGNYKENIKEALGEMNQLPGAAGAAAGGVQALGDQFKILLRNPIVLVLALIVGGVAALGKAFLKTEKGGQLLAKANSKVQGSLSALTKVSDQVATGIEKIFEDGVLEGFKTLGRGIVENVVNRLTAVLEMGKSVVKFFSGFGDALKGDFAIVEEAAEDAAAAIAQMLTGADKEEQIQIIKLTKEAKEEADRLAAAFDALNIATRKRKEQNISLIQSLGELRKAEGAASIAANDSTKSAKEQLAALDELEKAQGKIAKAEIQIARNRVSDITQEIKIRRSAKEDVIGLLEAQAEALVNLQDKENEYTFQVLEGEKVRREIRRDSFERGLDFAIDFYDAQKTQLEKQIADEEKTLEERGEILARLVELDRSAFEEQQKLLEDFTAQKLALNELALIDDERIVRARLEQYNLDDVTLGRILEVLKERKAATQDIADAEAELIKQRNEANGETPDLLFFNYDEKGAQLAADRLAKSAADALLQARIKFREELDKTPPEGSIYDLLGIRIGGDEREALTTAFDFAKEQLAEFAAFRTKIAEQNVENSRSEVDQAQRALDAELQNRAQGEASRVESAERELKEAKKRQAEALDEQRKAQRAEQRIQTAQQAVNLVTASSKIWSTLGFPLALPALAVLWGSFISAKVRASQLTKQTNRKGKYLDLDWGGNHESGNDIPFGVTKDGKQIMTAERGESMAVFTAKARQKYDLKNMVDALNRGEFEKTFTAASGGISQTVPIQVFNTNNSGANFGKAEGYLATIAKNSSGQTYFDAAGRRVVKYKNETTIYLN